jgi:hypothetical protein
VFNDPPSSSLRERRSRLAAGLLYALILAFGIWLRLDQITRQIPADDEWHALNYLLAADYWQTFLHFGYSDHCIPMTLLDKLIADTIGLSELGMRALPLLSGIAALVVLPALMLPRIGTKSTILFAALLAFSPLHVYFSRYARPYAVIFLFGLLGVIAFERFLATGIRRWGWIYVACAIFVPWFHPMQLPFMLAPFVFALVRELPDRERLLARVRELWPFAAVTAAGLLLLLAPPFWTDFEVMRERTGRGTFLGVTFRTGCDLLSGTDRAMTAILFAVACVIGVGSWLLRHRTLFAYFAFLFACQAAALAWSRPENVHIPITTVRYMLPLLGFLLMLAGEGLARIDGMLLRESRGWLPRHLPSTIACLAFVAWSPLLSPFEPHNAVYYRPNAWTNHALYQYQYRFADRELFLRDVVLPKRISSFYTKLAERSPESEPAARCIVETPWFFPWADVSYVVYQRVHHWPMAIGFVHQPGEPPPKSELPWPDARFRFENFVDLADFVGLRERGVAYVVFHKNFLAELPRQVRDPIPDIAPMLASYRFRFGEPCFEDEDLIVFDVLRPR